jgi:hypothetical protein
MITDLAASVPREHRRQMALHRAAAAAVTMDHGEVLSCAEVHSTARLVFLFVAMAMIVATPTAFAYFHPPSFIRLIPLLCFSLCFFGPKVVLIYENGIKLPRRYFRWEQIERCNWDGDLLTITGTGQDLSGRPVDGGSVRIWFGSPCFRHDPIIKAPSQWERIVAQKMAGRPAPEPSTTTLVQPAESKPAESPINNGKESHERLPLYSTPHGTLAYLHARIH